MSNFKKFLLLLPLFTLTLMAFSACSDDDDKKDEPTASLVGTWVEDEDGDTYTFNADGTGSYYYYDDKWDEEDYETFTWKATESILTLKYSYDDEAENIPYKLINATTLTMYDGRYTYHKR